MEPETAVLDGKENRRCHHAFGGGKDPVKAVETKGRRHCTDSEMSASDHLQAVKLQVAGPDLRKEMDNRGGRDSLLFRRADGKRIG